MRAFAGIVLLAAAFFVEWPEAWEGVVGLAGGVLLVTALARYCPFNQLIGKGAASAPAASSERRHAFAQRRQQPLTRASRYPDRREGPPDRRHQVS